MQCCGCHEWGLTQRGPSPLYEGYRIKAPEGTFPAIWVVLMEENAVLHEKWLFLPWSHTTSYSSMVVINMSAAYKITAVLHIAEVEGYVFSSSFEGQNLCCMVCLSLPLGLSERETVKWDRLSPCILLWVNIPLKCIWLFLWTGMCFSYAVIHLLVSGGEGFFPFWRDGSYFKAPIFQLINLNDSGQNPLWSIIVWVHLMHGVSACCGGGIYFFLAWHG